MPRFLTHFLVSGALFSVMTSCASVQSNVDSASATSDAVVVPRESLQYHNINPAIQMATAFGDMSSGAHGTFGKFPASFETPSHTHSGAYSAVVIKGEMSNPFEGETNPPVMKPGSYWYVPKGAIHSTACVSSTPCEFFFWADSGFDFTPVE